MNKFYVLIFAILIGQNLHSQSRVEFVNELNNRILNTFPNSNVILRGDKLTYMIFSKDYDSISSDKKNGIVKKLTSQKYSRKTKELFMQGFSSSIENDVKNYEQLGIYIIQAYITTRKKKYMLGTYHIN